MHLGTFEGEGLRNSRGSETPASHSRNVLALMSVAMFVMGASLVLQLLERGV